MIEPAYTPPDLRIPACGLLVGFLVLSPVVFWYGLIEPFEACKSTLSQLTAVALLVLAVTAARGRSLAWVWAKLRRLFRGPVGISIACAVLSALVSTVFSLSPRTSLQGALDSNMGLGSVLALAVLFAASRSLCANAIVAQQMLGAITLGLSLSCAYALVQALGSDPVRWAQPWFYHGWLRPSGTLGHPNYLAGYAVMALPVVLGQIRRAAEERLTTRILAGAIVALAATLTVVITLSRGAFIAGGLALVVLLVCWRVGFPRWRLLAVGSGFLVVFFSFDHPLKTVLLERIHGHISSPGRWPIWQGAIRLFMAYPITGSGLDTFGLAWPGVRTAEYWEVEWGFMPGKAHNDFLHALATQGILGAVAYGMLPLALLISLARAWRRGQRRDWIGVLASIAVAFYVQNLVGFAVASSAGLLAIVAGMVAALGEQKVDSGVADVPTSSPSVLSPVTWVGVGLVLVTLWQGGGGHLSWRLALVALTLSWAAIIRLAPNGFLGVFVNNPPLRFSQRTCRFGSLSGSAPVKASRLIVYRNRAVYRLVLVATKGDEGSCLSSNPRAFSLHLWRPVVLPTLGGLILAWLLLLPLLASALSFRAKQWIHRDLEKGLSEHQWAVRLAPSCAILHERLARALEFAAAQEPTASRRRELLSASRESIETACRLEPLSARFQANRARILFDLACLGGVEGGEVLAAFDRAVALDRYDWFVVADAARAAVTLGYPRECERYLEAALAEQPRLGLLLAERGALELARGQRVQAKRTLQQAQESEWFGERERFDRASLLLGTVLLQLGHPGEARSQIEPVLVRHRDWIPAWLIHAHCRERLGHKQEALEGFRHILLRQPDHEQARAGVARLE